MPKALDDEVVLEMREWWSEGGTYKEIAEGFGLRQNIVWNVVNRETYKHLPGGVYFKQLEFPGFCRNGHPLPEDHEKGTKCRLCYRRQMRLLAERRKAERCRRRHRFGLSRFDPSRKKGLPTTHNTVTVWFPGIWVQGRLY